MSVAHVVLLLEAADGAPIAETKLEVASQERRNALAHQGSPRRQAWDAVQRSVSVLVVVCVPCTARSVNLARFSRFSPRRPVALRRRRTVTAPARVARADPVATTMGFPRRPRRRAGTVAVTRTVPAVTALTITASPRASVPVVTRAGTVRTSGEPGPGPGDGVGVVPGAGVEPPGGVVVVLPPAGGTLGGGLGRKALMSAPPI